MDIMSACLVVNPISVDTRVIQKVLTMVSYLRNCYCNQNYITHCMWLWVLPIHVRNLEFLTRPDLMLYKFVDNTVRVHGHEKSRF